jgi:acetylornithine deacetylase/succinyl-diaminopimelate desuccinylase-like protein
MKKWRMSKLASVSVFLTLTFFLANSVSAQSMRPDAEKELARDIYKQFIEIPSGFTTGSTTPVAEAAAARLRTGGFPDADIFLGGASPKKQNIIVRYYGSGRRKPILLLAHIDVVDAKREDWSLDPFVLSEEMMKQQPPATAAAD